MDTIQHMATTLDDAARQCQPIAQFSASGHELSLADAYKVQSYSIAKRASRGERIVGVKMGFTSRAKMIQMGVNDLIWGQISDAMVLEDGGNVTMKRFIHPRIEPEVVFLLKRPLSGKITLLDAESAIEAAAPALEIIDSRYRDFKFSLSDVVADNCSSSGVIIGAWRKAADDISNLGMVMSSNGSPMQIGSSAAILGNPLRSVVAAARLAGEVGLTLEAGWFVMAGAATAAEPLSSKIHVQLDVEDLGRVEITTTE